MTHEDYINEALKLAADAMAHNDVPVGAVVVLDGKIIGRGENRREIDSDPLAHAEVIALRNAAKTTGSWNLSNASLYVTLEPCAMCAGAIVNSRIKNLYFGGDMAAMWSPMSWTVIFGLTFSTFLTLVIVPVMYRMTTIAQKKFSVLVDKFKDKRTELMTP